MGCVSSTLLNHDDDFSQIGRSTAFSHHIVSLTSTTYGLLTLDPPTSDPHHYSPTTTLDPTPTPPPRFTLETINSQDLMSGLVSPSKLSSYLVSDKTAIWRGNEENFCPNVVIKSSNDINVRRKYSLSEDFNYCHLLERFERICPPNGENKVVIYTTTLRGVRKTFEDCNAVRSAIEGVGVVVCERDISMDRGFKDELRELMKEKEKNELIPPRVFVKGKYIGGIEEVMKIAEEGSLGELLQGLPKTRCGYVCEGCGGIRFLPCFRCNGSCKMVVADQPRN
ncbi:Glutaredoxin family protein [Forsythia ovata]|uniref:Glutaredoxin family protein n=1 Tax=Forsythia ovata TaxID=205694 RepID=A0ABD1WMZ9_9LAMI